MFELDWGKLVVIGVVALIVIGPKELPTVLRTVGQWVTKIRRMASEFQGQFQEAMREAEIADLKKQVDSMGDLSHDYTASSSADTAEHVPAPDHASSDHVPAPDHASSADHGHSAPDGAVGTTSDETTPLAHSPVPAEPHAAPEQHATPDPHPIAAAQQHGGVAEPASEAQATVPHKAGGQAA